jgi:hypothetical protein
MKKKLQFCKPIFTLLCGAVLLFALTTCGDPGTGAYVMSDQAVLTHLSIGSGQYEVVPGGNGAYSAIDSRTWDNYDEDVDGQEYGIINIKREADTINSRINVTASRSSRVEWGIGDKRNRPSFFQDIRVPANFSSQDYIYIKVTSENTKVINYYRFYAWVLKNGVSLADVFIDGKRAEIETHIDQESLLDGLAAGSISITEKGAEGDKDDPDSMLHSPNNPLIKAIGFDEDSVFRFAWVRENSGETPVFRSLNPITIYEGDDENIVESEEEGEEPTITITPVYGKYFVMTEALEDQDILYIEVTAQNEVDRGYYKFLVSVGRVANISRLFFGNEETMGKGIPNANFASVRLGSYASADQPTGGFSINIITEDPAADYEYALIANTSVNTAPSFSGKPEQVEFDNVKALAIKVTSSNGKLELFYKIKVDLLPGLFKRQPESKVYYYYKDPATIQPVNPEALPARWIYVDYPSPTEFESDVPQPIDFELDRPIPGATYQWYESNSWYGGYGFDANGKVSYIDYTGRAVEQEAGFVADDYHAKNFDEKKNPSLFNGGNQGPPHYVLDGKAIVGATGETYTPKIDYRPFIGGFSSESHYYWVEITAPDGRKVTSARASIVSERDKRKKYYIIDTNNDYKPNGPNSVPKPFKNEIPFQKRDDKFRIPIKFPQKDPQDPSRDFDILDYSIMTVQAKFYLVDGTPWIQNWTQGNLSFEDNSKKPDISQYGTGGDILVLYYNLTNNNSTYMMDGDSKEPQGADLRTPLPTHVVIIPSGDHTKGTTKNGYPPLVESGGKMVAAPSIVGTNLQGWFCGFIELVELRFEGPPRQPK